MNLVYDCWFDREFKLAKNPLAALAIMISISCATTELCPGMLPYRRLWTLSPRLATLLNQQNKPVCAGGAAATCQIEGRGVPKDIAQAVRWLQKPAELGLPFAQSILGGLADQAGKYVEALKWYRLAADQGVAEAQNNLGNMYDTGRGVTQSYTEAAKWYRLAAGQGLATTQYNLGVMYDNGYGVTRDYAEAAKWYGLAAAQGDPEAQYSLGILYDNGTGVAQDDAEAAKWFVNRKTSRRWFSATGVNPMR